MSESSYILSERDSSPSSLDASSLVRYYSPTVVTSIELATFLLQPVLFYIAVRLRVYTRFPASLFRWIMLIDWIQSAWRLVQWTPFLPSSAYLDVPSMSRHSSMATC